MVISCKHNIKMIFSISCNLIKVCFLNYSIHVFDRRYDSDSFGESKNRFSAFSNFHKFIGSDSNN